MTGALWYRWNGAVLIPMRPDAAARQFEIEGRYLLETHHDRSERAHSAYFAQVREAWTNLATDDFASPEHLRKFALIRTGWRDERTIICGSRMRAEALAAFMAPLDDYAVYAVEGRLLRVWTARSQSHRAMGRDDFRRSMDDVLGYCASLLGVARDELAAQGESA